LIGIVITKPQSLPTLIKTKNFDRNYCSFNNFIGPIVGIHVRRTDKITETKLRKLEEYMVRTNKIRFHLIHTRDPPIPDS